MAGIFSPEALVTGGFRSQYRASARIVNDFICLFDGVFEGYCIDAPEVIPAGSTARTSSYAQPAPMVVYRKHLS